MLSEYRELPLLEVFCHATRRYLIRQDSLLECPKWFRWRSAPGYSSLLRDSFNLDSTAPRSIRYHVMPLNYERPVIGNVFPFEVILFIERIFVHWIFVVQISILLDNQLYANNGIKNAKLMSVLKFFKIRFLVKQNLQECDINSGFIASPTGVRIPFVTVCFQTNPCFS